MAESGKVKGAAGGAALGALIPDIYQTMLATVKWEWEPESQASLARIMTAIVAALLGILVTARDRILEAIEESEIEEVKAGIVERLVNSKVAKGIGLRVERRAIPRVTPEEPEAKDKIIKPLPREEKPK